MEYSPLLHDNSIRLLHIQSGTFDQDLICETVDALADPMEGIPYSALSYTWGETGQKKQIISVNGCEFPITENLYAALRRIRKIEQSIYTWIDAICINQDSEEEKGHQVKQMGVIYAGAEEVLIWLGEGDEYTDSFMDLVNWISKVRVQSPPIQSDWAMLHFQLDAKIEYLNKHPVHKEMQLDAEGIMRVGLGRLVAKSWFNRIWVLQEVAMAKRANIICGTKSCSVKFFALMPTLLKFDLSTHATAVIELMPYHRTLLEQKEDRTLLNLLRKYEKSAATLPRDRIYALLGLSADACDPRRFYPCYKKSDDDVLRDTVSFVIFGEVLDSSYLLPNFAYGTIIGDMTALFYQTLQWLLFRDGVQIRKTINLFISYLNERRFKGLDTNTFIQNIAKWGGPFTDLLFPFTIRADFDNPEYCALKSPFHDNEHHSAGIKRLIDTNASKEDLLRAYVWMGDAKSAGVMFRTGMDIDKKYTDGHTVKDLLLLVDGSYNATDRSYILLYNYKKKAKKNS